MKTIIIAWLVIPLVCVIGAIYLIIQGKDGWGWLLFVAVLFGAGVSYKDKDEKKNVQQKKESQSPTEETPTHYLNKKQ